MNERIHAFLDGAFPRGAPTPKYRAPTPLLSSPLDVPGGGLPAAAAPDLTARVMAALPAPAPRRAPSPVAALLAWLWSPRPLRLTLRPAYGLAFAALVLLALAFGRSGRGAMPAAPLARRALPVVMASAPAAPPPVYVQFRVRVPDARSVALAGTFTDWKPAVALTQTAPGEWSALVPLRPGVHDYAFVVDGQRWMADPNAPQVDDSFGGTNSRISLPPLGAS